MKTSLFILLLCTLSLGQTPIDKLIGKWKLEHHLPASALMLTARRLKLATTHTPESPLKFSSSTAPASAPAPSGDLPLHEEASSVTASKNHLGDQAGHLSSVANPQRHCIELQIQKDRITLGLKSWTIWSYRLWLSARESSHLLLWPSFPYKICR